MNIRFIVLLLMVVSSCSSLKNKVDMNAEVTKCEEGEYFVLYEDSVSKVVEMDLDVNGSKDYLATVYDTARFEYSLVALVNTDSGFSCQAVDRYHYYSVFAEKLDDRLFNVRSNPCLYDSVVYFNGEFITHYSNKTTSQIDSIRFIELANSGGPELFEFGLTRDRVYFCDGDTTIFSDNYYKESDSIMSYLSMSDFSHFHVEEPPAVSSCYNPIVKVTFWYDGGKSGEFYGGNEICGNRNFRVFEKHVFSLVERLINN